MIHFNSDLSSQVHSSVIILCVTQGKIRVLNNKTYTFAMLTMEFCTKAFVSVEISCELELCGNIGLSSSLAGNA